MRPSPKGRRQGRCGSPTCTPTGILLHAASPLGEATAVQKSEFIEGLISQVYVGCVIAESTAPRIRGGALCQRLTHPTYISKIKYQSYRRFNITSKFMSKVN